MAFSRCDLNVEDLLDKMAVYFQIRDDLLNLVSLKYMEHKSFCEDITEGKFSYPLIHAIRSDEGDHQILNILKQHTKSVEIKKHALKYMMKMVNFLWHSCVMRLIRVRSSIPRKRWIGIMRKL